MKIKVIFTILFLFAVARVAANPIEGLLDRLHKGYSKRFEIKITPLEDSQEDFFEIKGGGDKVVIVANNNISAATAINWYLKYYCNFSISFCEDQITKLPKQLPQVDERRSTPLTTNFYMNYCTFSYSTAFWDWERWEREIDLMALNGITTPMAMVGSELIWRNLLERFKFSNKEIREFLCGPAYFGWLLMGNLEKLGGPLPDEWFEQQESLQHKILARMREYGMKPVFQGFYGMVPAALQEKFPEAHIIDQGSWNGLKRPPVLSPLDPLFKSMAKVWYEEYRKLFGDADYFGGDLFHEGGHSGGIDVTKAAQSVQSSMTDRNPNAIWVVQSWGGNPTKALLDGMKPENTLVVDLCAEFWDHWRTSKGFSAHPWVWSHLTNYGRNVGIHGRLDAIAKGVIEGRIDPIASKVMKGTGNTPEAIEVNPVVFDLANEMRWRNDSPDVSDWVKNYAQRRYGDTSSELQEAWDIFYQSAYGTYEGHRRPSESVFCALPSLKRDNITASAWSQCKTFYDTDLFAGGVSLLLEARADLKNSETYRYDVVDFVRQYLADLGRKSYYNFVDAYNQGDKETFEQCSQLFLRVMADQDILLSTHSSFFVGSWINEARSRSKDAEIQDLYEYNARLLIGTWTESSTAVRDYAHKEWGGIIRDYYLPRWVEYIQYLSDKLDGKDVEAPDSFEMEKRWVNSRNKYRVDTKSNSIDVATELFYKYYR